MIAKTLTSRYQVAQDHLLLLADVSRIRLEQSVPAFLDKVPADAQLLVFLDAQAYVDPQGKVYLAPTDFALGRIDATGVSLQAFVECWKNARPKTSCCSWISPMPAKGPI